MFRIIAANVIEEFTFKAVSNLYFHFFILPLITTWNAIFFIEQNLFLQIVTTLCTVMKAVVERVYITSTLYIIIYSYIL